jgi:SAM-dependent methyltransferase
MKIFSHYGRLVYFTFNRFKGDNYTRMREYLAEVFLEEIEQFTSLTGKKVLDVGGANGEFCRVLEDHRKTWTLNLDLKFDPNLPVWERSVKASAVDMPFPEGSFDVVLCRGVIEHVPPAIKEGFLRDIHRVLKPGGYLYLMTQPWWNQHPGHQLKPFHILPFPAAKFLRRLFFRNKIPGNSYAEEHLYPNTFSYMLRLIRESGLRYVKGFDTHLKLHFMNRIPVLREIAVPSVAFICKKDAPQTDPKLREPSRRVASERGADS